MKRHDLFGKKWAFFALLLLLSILVRAQAPQPNNSLLWKVTGGNHAAPSYLYGTFHIVPAGYLPPDGKVMQAFQAAQSVVVETLIDSTELTKFAGMAVMPGKSIKKMLSESQYAEVASELLAATGVPLAALDNLMPVTGAILLAMAYYEKESAVFKELKGAPLDQYFASEGKKLGKKVNALETMEEQMNVIYNGETPEKQAETLAELVRDKDKVKQMSANLVRNWLAEDLDAIALGFEEYVKLQGSSDFLLKDRNIKWMNTLPGLVDAGNTFIAVGAMHLTGESGLIELLRDKGYKLEPVFGE